MVVVSACKTKSKIAGSKKPVQQLDKITPVKASNISLYDKPLDVVRKHVEGQKWQLVYAIGGLTGNDKNTYEQTYYTFTTDGEFLEETPSGEAVAAFEWVKKRDIYTGDSTYILSGPLNWKIKGIVNDTLTTSDNYVDGYHYALIRAE